MFFVEITIIDNVTLKLWPCYAEESVYILGWRCLNNVRKFSVSFVFEKDMKIISNKHSAARTAVEQPADAGPMFKVMKGVIKVMPTESVTVSPIIFLYHRSS